MAFTLFVRQALPTDAPALQSLYAQLVDDPRIHVTGERIQAVLDDPRTALFVCEMGEGRDVREEAVSIAGTALVSLCADVMYGDQPFAVVENVVVDAAKRGRGVGLAVLAGVEAFCLAADCSKMMLLSSMARVDAHRFFERAGFVGDRKRGFVKYRGAFGEGA